MKKLNKFIPLFSLSVLFPVLVLAFNTDPCLGVEGIGGFLCKINQTLNSIIPVLILLGVVYFVWGVVRYVIADGEEAKKKGRDQIIYGIIGLAVIVSLWGLVNILVATFELKNNAPPLSTLTVTAPVQGGSCASIGNTSKFQDVLCYFTRIINDAVIPLIFAVAVAFFIWGAVQFFILNAGEETKREQGRQFMIWGIVALAVMLSVWGLVGILTNTFGIEGSVLPQVSPSAVQ